VSSSADAERIGQQVLGRYRVVQRLAQGGMGVVYLGRLDGAAGFAKPVVIKRIISDAEDQQGSTARFIREAQILSNLQHPGIVGVLDFGEEDERYSMVLEYVNGYDLGRWLKYLQLKAHKMHWEEAVFIILRVLDALAHAHGFRRSDGTSAEVLHRDISPGNVLLDVEGRVRLVDFGIARMDAGTGEQFKTETGVLKGKLAYLAPELFAGMPPSPASDL
jgi:serine/threonine protein kinase